MFVIVHFTALGTGVRQDREHLTEQNARDAAVAQRLPYGFRVYPASTPASVYV